MKNAYNYVSCLYLGNDNDSSDIGTECPMRNETDDNSGPVRLASNSLGSM